MRGANSGRLQLPQPRARKAGASSTPGAGKGATGPGVRIPKEPGGGEAGPFPVIKVQTSRAGDGAGAVDGAAIPLTNPKSRGAVASERISL